MTPLGDHVLVKIRDEEEQRDSGLVVVKLSNGNEALSNGTIVAVGDGKVSEYTSTRLPMEVRSGEVVFFHSYAGAEILIGGEKHKLLRQGDLVAKDE